MHYAGWGAFLGRAAVKDDFLGEYVGELLSQAEADRRGKAYDRSNNSYLFGVNSAWCLDAKDSGNNLRFANHRSQPNCQARCVELEADALGATVVQDKLICTGCKEAANPVAGSILHAMALHLR
jgi:SET domain-containing protein